MITVINHEAEPFVPAMMTVIMKYRGRVTQKNGRISSPWWCADLWKRDAEIFRGYVDEMIDPIF